MRKYLACIRKLRKNRLVNVWQYSPGRRLENGTGIELTAGGEFDSLPNQLLDRHRDHRQKYH